MTDSAKTRLFYTGDYPVSSREKRLSVQTGPSTGPENTSQETAIKARSASSEDFKAFTYGRRQTFKKAQIDHYPRTMGAEDRWIDQDP